MTMLRIFLLLLFCPSLFSSPPKDAQFHAHTDHDETLTNLEHQAASDAENRQFISDTLPEELAKRLGLRDEEPIREAAEKDEVLPEETNEADQEEDGEIYDKRPLLGLAMTIRVNEIPFAEKSLASILPFVDTYTIILEEKQITARAKRFSERQKRSAFAEEEKKTEDSEEESEEVEEESDSEENSESDQGNVDTEESILEENTRNKQRIQSIINDFFKVQKVFETGSTLLAERGSPFLQKSGELLHLPFVDFSTSKNQALTSLGLKTIFAFVLQPEEVFAGDGLKLREFCEEHVYSDGVDHEVYLISYQHSNRTQYYLERLIRTGYDWFYFGSTYEALLKTGAYAKIRAPSYLSIAFRAAFTPEQQTERWELNKKLLERDHKADQNNTRTIFYLAQTYANLKEWGKALVFYDKRARAGGWKEEVYDALYSKAFSASQVKRPWHEVQHFYLHAFSQSGAKRAEPLYALAYQYFMEKEYSLCYLFGSAAANVPYPKDSTLFIDAELYSWRAADVASLCAYNVEKYEDSIKLVQKALNGLSPITHKEIYQRLTDNLNYFKAGFKKQQNDAFKTYTRTGEKAPL